MLISVQKARRDPNGELVATVLDGQGGTVDLRLASEDAEAVEREWARSKFDLDRYGRLPIGMPAPAAIPVAISDEAARDAAQLS